MRRPLLFQMEVRTVIVKIKLEPMFVETFEKATKRIAELEDELKNINPDTVVHVEADVFGDLAR